MAAATAGNPIDLCFEKLATCIRNSQHKKALKAADEVLAIEPKNVDALSCKVASLIQQGDYVSALSVLSKMPAGSMPFEKAYCLYRTSKLEEGLEACKTISEEDAECRLQLEAQIHYRLGQNKDCIQLYDSLFQQHKVESVELKTNVLAAYVAAGLAAEVPALLTAMKVTPKQSFEIGYNKACSLVEAGDWSAAEGDLRMALKTGRETLFSEDCTEEEVEEELSPLTVQLGYVLSKQGKVAEAQELYDAVLKSQEDWEDPSRGVAYNNSVAESGKVDASSNHKKYVASATKRMEAMLDNSGGEIKPSQTKMNPSLESRLSPHQKQTFNLNRALLYLLAGRLEPAKGVMAELGKVYEETVPLALMRAALLLADGKGPEADAALQQFSTAGGSSSLLPTLMRAQMAMESNSTARALELLTSLPKEDANRGAVLATRLALHQQLGDSAGAESLLESGISSWQQRNTDPGASDTLSCCFQNLVQLKLKLGKVEDAMSSYRTLQKLQGSGAGAGHSVSTASVLARLARAMAVSDPSSVPALVSKEMPAISAAELKGLNLDLLEDSLATRGNTATASKLPVPKKDLENMKSDGMVVDVEQIKKKRTKRKRKPVYPKGYNPELPNGGLPPPDPERWMAKWQRTDFKKKKVTSQQRKNETVKGSQGAGKVDDSLDRAKHAVVPKAEKTAMPSLPPKKKKGKK